jgi:hypothetical protein
MTVNEDTSQQYSPPAQTPATPLQKARFPISLDSSIHVPCHIPWRWSSRRGLGTGEAKLGWALAPRTNRSPANKRWRRNESCSHPLILNVLDVCTSKSRAGRVVEDQTTGARRYKP